MNDKADTCVSLQGSKYSLLRTCHTPRRRYTPHNRRHAAAVLSFRHCTSLCVYSGASSRMLAAHDVLESRAGQSVHKHGLSIFRTSSDTIAIGFHSTAATDATGIASPQMPEHADAAISENRCALCSSAAASQRLMRYFRIYYANNCECLNVYTDVCT